jgi:hypothetical protein
VPPLLKAWLLLAWTLLATLVRRLFGGGRRGIGAFAENYAADGLSAVSPDQRAAMASFGRCFACGLCDRGEAARIAASGGAYLGVMQLVLASSRSMPDFAASARGFARVPPEVLEQKERICPGHVPIRALARFVQDKAAEARVSASATASERSPTAT